jgi:AraC-like DNA-binding protein
MTLLHSAPRPSLSEFVELFWLYEGDPRPHARERVLPTGTLELVIDLRDGVGGAVICGAHSQSFVLDTARQVAVLGVHFKPGGAFPFLRPPAGELHDAHVPLDALWGPRAAELRERVLEAPTPAAKFRALERALRTQAVRPLARHPAVAFALEEFRRRPARPVAAVVEQTGLSSRRFVEAFTDEVGLTPKLFCRVRRFQEVLRHVGQCRQIEWARVALACGYYDQAHFIHDFRAFSGFSPTDYLARRGEHLNHVPLDG